MILYIILGNSLLHYLNVEILKATEPEAKNYSLTMLPSW